MYAARILHHFGTPEGAYFAGREELQACPGLPEKVRQALEDKDLSQADQILAQCEALGIWVLTCQDAAYPQRLGQLDSAPCVLYGRGRLPQMDQEAAVALVGARQASPYGIMAAGRLGLDLARQGALVVSGMAQGRRMNFQSQKAKAAAKVRMAAAAYRSPRLRGSRAR